MRVLMTDVPRKTAYKIIDGFRAGFASMNYPVTGYREGVLTFVDIDEGFKKTVIRYDGVRKQIVMDYE